SARECYSLQPGRIIGGCSCESTKRRSCANSFRRSRGRSSTRSTAAHLRAISSRTRATGGFGLGLAIAKALVEAYGGHITASSTVGKGTRITVELPILNAEEMAHTAPT